VVFWEEGCGCLVEMFLYLVQSTSFVPGTKACSCTWYKINFSFQTHPFKQGNFELCRIGIVVTLLEKGRVYDKKP
jgi:hypothetical protein